MEPTERPQHELLMTTFSDEQEIHVNSDIQTVSTPRRSGIRFRQRVRSTWFGGFPRWRARQVTTPIPAAHRNICANSHPVYQTLMRQRTTPCP